MLTANWINTCERSCLKKYAIPKNKLRGFKKNSKEITEQKMLGCQKKWHGLKHRVVLMKSNTCMRSNEIILLNVLSGDFLNGFSSANYYTIRQLGLIEAFLFFSAESPAPRARFTRTLRGLKKKTLRGLTKKLSAASKQTAKMFFF